MLPCIAGNIDHNTIKPNASVDNQQGTIKVASNDANIDQGNASESNDSTNNKNDGSTPESVGSMNTHTTYTSTATKHAQQNNNDNNTHEIITRSKTDFYEPKGSYVGLTETDQMEET